MDTESVRARFHRVFFKTKVTEPFTGPVGDALKSLRSSIDSILN
jgi:hypothetical protein